MITITLMISSIHYHSRLWHLMLWPCRHDMRSRGGSTRHVQRICHHRTYRQWTWWVLQSKRIYREIYKENTHTHTTSHNDAVKDFINSNIRPLAAVIVSYISVSTCMVSVFKSQYFVCCSPEIFFVDFGDRSYVIGCIKFTVCNLTVLPGHCGCTSQDRFIGQTPFFFTILILPE